MPPIAFIPLCKAESAENRPFPSLTERDHAASARTELWAILRLAGPLIASQLAHMLMVLTDTLMMARLSPRRWPVADWARRVIRSCRFSASA
jgi:Na+-driven multidrug efflux pump